jgi:hypothetical protein
MPFDFQIAVDASQPHVLADWWAETLGWVVEPSDESFIRRMITEGYASEDDTMMHNGALVWKEGAAIRHPDVPSGLARPRILFQLVPELKTVQNRVPLEVRVGEPSVWPSRRMSTNQVRSSSEALSLDAYTFVWISA